MEGGGVPTGDVFEHSYTAGMADRLRLDDRMVANVAAVLVAVATGLFVMRGTEGTVPLPLIGLAGLLWLGALLVMRAGVLLIGWVALISFLEPAAADASPAGRVLVWALYVAPV